MTTYVRAPEAARRLGVTTATLYSYVSRGRIVRTLGSDGRTSLFDLADIDGLVARSSRPVPPAPTIDVRISTNVTQLDENGVRYRGELLADLVDEPYESIAHLLWTGEQGSTNGFPPLAKSVELPEPVQANINGLIRLAAELSETTESTGDPVVDAHRAGTLLLSSIPAAFNGSSDRRRIYADRLTRAWVARPSPQLVRAVNATLVLLADHELATSALAVRVATSVRSSPMASLIAGLAAVEGALHGSAGAHAHQLFVDAEADGADTVIRRHHRNGERIAGFGHKVYRNRDPRFELLMERVRLVPDPRRRLEVVHQTIATSSALVSQQPNIDLAVGALSYVADLPADAPLFAIARIAGWTAHHIEELGERPVRFRGLAH